MELFAAAGLDLPAQSKAQPRVKPASLPTLRAPLFAYKAVNDALERSGFAPDDAMIRAAKDYARKIKGLKAAKETTFRPIFVDEVMVNILGYSRLDPDKPYTLVYEQRLGKGAVDTALGHFDAHGMQKIAAPFELKGPDTHDLDRIMPGRGKTPVQQAWDYANDAPGAKWVLVSNCAEIRLYGYGRGRAAYEVFDLSRLDQLEELRRLWEILGAKNFLDGKTDALLRATDSAFADITDALYESYKGLRGQLIDYLTNTAEGPKLSLGKAIEPAQKILDRILFIAFAQQNDLMHGDLMHRALKANNEFEPTPLWRNFLGLFRKVDKGDFDMDIPPYNGGLFAHDPVVDTLVLPDHLTKEIAALGQWDYKREVPVAVLGHIFEKSITDIDKMRAEARGVRRQWSRRGRRSRRIGRLRHVWHFPQYAPARPPWRTAFIFVPQMRQGRPARP